MTLICHCGVTQFDESMIKGATKIFDPLLYFKPICRKLVKFDSIGYYNRFFVLSVTLLYTCRTLHHSPIFRTKHRLICGKLTF